MVNKSPLAHDARALYIECMDRVMEWTLYTVLYLVWSSLAVKSLATSIRALAEAYHKYCWNNDFNSDGERYYADYMQIKREAAGNGKVMEY